jgi:RNase P protein component
VVRGAVLSAVVGLLVAVASAGGAGAPPSPWDGVNPFACELQNADYGTTVPHPDADPFCVEYAKRKQNVTELGVVEFLTKEPARVALASPKCFYFQSDHWRGSIVQDDGSTKTYEWDGHYFFNKATGDGGAWVTNFNVNGQTGDPSTIPGLPPDYAKYFGPGTGGAITHDEIPADPTCVAKAAENPPYAAPPPAKRKPACADAAGGVGSRHLGPVTLGMRESEVWQQLGSPVRVHRGFLRYCVRGGGKELVGVPGDRSGTEGGPSDEPVVFLLTTAKAQKARGVGRNASSRVLRRAFPRARRLFVQGHTYVMLLRPGVLAGLRDGRVRFLAVFEPRRVNTSRALRDWLRRSQ